MIEVQIAKNDKMRNLSENKVLNAVYEAIEKSGLTCFSIAVTKDVRFYTNVYYIHFEKLFWYKNVDIDFIMSETGKIDISIHRFDENDDKDILFKCTMKLDCEQFIKLTKKLIKYNEMRNDIEINRLLEERQQTTENLLNFCI